MNVGRFDKIVSLIDPIYVSNDYGETTEEDGIHYIRRGELIPKHSKYISMRYAGGFQADGILRLRKENFINKCKRLIIDNVVYNIDSVIETNKMYVELVITATKDNSYGSDI